MLDVDNRLRMTHGIGKDETEANLKVFQDLQQRGHPEVPPPLISDGWDGIDKEMLLFTEEFPNIRAEDIHLFIPNLETTGSTCRWSNSKMSMDVYRASA